MLVEYDDESQSFHSYKIIIDKEIDFVMLEKCYQNGCNCYTCTERVFDGCVIDEINIDDI